MKPIFCFMGLPCLLRTEPVSLNAKALRRGERKEFKHEDTRARKNSNAKTLRREFIYRITDPLRLRGFAFRLYSPAFQTLINQT